MKETILANIPEQEIFDLIDRLEVRGPRYTSYPTAPVWSSELSVEPYIQALKRIRDEQNAIAIYVHLPFCRQMCSFCGCNAYVSNNETRFTRYADALKSEISTVTQILGGKVKHSALHLGGGTPTHMPVDMLKNVLKHIISGIPGIVNAERSVEVDPRVTTPEHLRMMYELGFRRISIGLQDTELEVQQAINRVYSLPDMLSFVNSCRDIGYTSVNIDLIYGLPLQSRESWRRNLDSVQTLDPDRIACFGYAHLPEKIRNQRAINEDHLPEPHMRLGMMLDARKFYLDHGYKTIGFDHFAKPDDSLSIAQEKGKLWRNFMGYTEISGLEMVGFGCSSISEFRDLYVQNIVKPNDYCTEIESDKLAVHRGHILDNDDQMRKELISNLMCNLAINIPEQGIHSSNGAIDELKAAMSSLHKYELEGFIVPNQHAGYKVTELGELFLRNLAMPFDKYLPSQSQVKFSQTV